MRSLPKKGKRTPSELQQLQRQRFLTVTEFLTPFNSVLKKYYGKNFGDTTRMNNALSYHIKEAVAFVDPNFEILYNKVQISKGELLGFKNPVIASPSSNEVSFSWEDNSDEGEAKATDKVVVVLYAPIANLYFYKGNVGVRSDGTATLTLPGYFSGLEVQSWIAFASADDKTSSTSIHMDPVTVA